MKNFEVTCFKRFFSASRHDAEVGAKAAAPQAHADFQIFFTLTFTFCGKFP